MEKRRNVAGWTVLAALFVGMCAQTVAGASDEDAVAASTSSTTTLQTSTTEAATVDPGPLCPSAFCVVYQLRPGLTWSDGLPVGVEDFERTIAVMTDPVRGRGPDSGYDHVVSVSETDDGRVMVALDRVYDRWQSLFDVLLPRQWSADDPLSGPFAGSFTTAEWVPGDYLVATRREPGEGGVEPTPGAVEEITFLYQATPAQALEAFEAGEVDVVASRATTSLVETATALEDSSFSLTPGPFWEHVTFNLSDPMLAKEWVRRVIAMTIDRPAAIESALGEIDPGAEPLGNTLVLPPNPASASHFDVDYEPEAAEQILVDHGCARGEDGIYVCDGAPMSFSWVTSSGDPDRQALASQVGSALAAIGVELRPVFLAPSELLTPRVLYGDASVWQLINFSWNGASDPGLSATMYDCDGGAPDAIGLRNIAHYCSEPTQVLLERARSTIDPAARVAAYNEVDAAALGDLPVVPLYQKPSLLVTRSSLQGPRPSVGSSTDLWNVASWTGMARITVAVDSEPDLIDPVGGSTGGQAMVTGVLYPGLFVLTPELDYLPLLVESAETIIGGS